MDYYISDLHLGHANVIRWDKRPFDSIGEMHREIIRRWNRTVTPKDTVWLLGDVAWNTKTAQEILPQLRGTKHLILGNHDKQSEEFFSLFSSVRELAVLKDQGQQVILCHYPIAHWQNQYRNAVHLYGHVHNTQDDAAFLHYGAYCRSMGIPFEAYNVGCMLPYMDYTPRTLAQIREANRTERT